MERITLRNTEFEGDNTVYLFDGDRPALVDAGVATADVREQVEAALAERGLGVADLEAVLVTHWHHDHAGLAGAFQRESGATVRAHPVDAPLVSRDPDSEADLADLRTRLFEEWGMPAGPREELESFLSASSGHAGEPASVDPLSGGDRVQAGDETLEAVHTPGHTGGHLAFRRPDGSVLAGDALLPEYTPNVGGADPRVEDPLGTYLETLAWFETDDADRVYPGHRAPIADPAGRAREIREHHRERTERVLGVLADLGTADAWTVSAELFGSLSNIHVLHGPGEAWAHLEHLRRHGLVECVDGSYRALDPGADVDALFS